MHNYLTGQSPDLPRQNNYSKKYIVVNCLTPVEKVTSLIVIININNFNCIPIPENKNCSILSINSKTPNSHISGLE